MLGFQCIMHCDQFSLRDFFFYKLSLVPFKRSVCNQCEWSLLGDLFCLIYCHWFPSGDNCDWFSFGDLGSWKDVFL